MFVLFVREFALCMTSPHVYFVCISLESKAIKGSFLQADIK